MNIGLYGDSFAIINTRFMFRGQNLGPGWPELLEDEGKHKVTNYGHPGTAFMYSYERFLENHNRFDLNIIVVSNPDRTHIKALDGILMFGPDWADIEIERVKKRTWYPKKAIHLEILNSVKGYLKYWADWEMNRHIQHVLVSNLWNIAPNTIVIPGFDTSIAETTNNLNDCAYHELSIIDPEKFKIHPLGAFDKGKRVICRRKCHFSDENNRMIYNLITDAIDNNKRIVEVEKSMIVKPKITDYYHFVELIEEP